MSLYMSKIKGKEILIPTISLFIICLVVTALLAGTNALTVDKIAQQAEQNAIETRAQVLPNAVKFKEIEDKAGSYFIGEGKDGATVGYTFATSAKGYGGNVDVMVGIDSIKGKVSGVAILSQNETPGLGANAANESFTNQYRQSLDFGSVFSVVKNKTPEDGEIEAITGATITSQAVTDAVNHALKQYKEIVKEAE